MKHEKPILLTYSQRRHRPPAWALDWMVLAGLMFLAMIGLLLGKGLINRLW